MNKKFTNFEQFKKEFLKKYPSSNIEEIKKEIELTGEQALIEEQNKTGNIEIVKGKFEYKKFKFEISIKSVAQGNNLKELERIYKYIC